MVFKYKKILFGGLVALPISMSAFGASVAEDTPSYLDQQQSGLVSQNVLMADTSSQSYTEELTYPFTSFYIGAGANLANTDVESDLYVVGKPKKEFKDDNDDFGGNVNLGYGVDLNNFYIGGEAFFNYIDSSGDENEALLNDYDFGGDIRFGYILQNRLMVYLLGGVDVVKFDSDVLDISTTKLGFMPGVGAEFLFNDNWGIRAQYTYTFYPTISKGVSDTASWDYKVHRGNISVDVIYRFN